MTASSSRWLLGAIFTAAAVLLLAGSWYSYTSTFDTATVGLMSVNIAQGDRPLFFYGQPYFGALEAYLAALFISLFGFSEFVVSLSPISFTLAWIIFSFLLFARIHDRTAGIIAAACTAFPGYYVFWYSIATYGGYSAILCIGTAILWLSLRVLQEDARGMPLLLQTACIGILMGLGIWIHPLIFPYLAIGGGLLGLFTFKGRFRLDIVISLGLAFCLALGGFLPFYVETGSFLGGMSETVQLSWAVIIKALSNLFATNIYELVVWNFTHTFDSPLIRYLALYSGLLVFSVAALLACYALIATQKQQLNKGFYLVPAAFCLLFLLLYVQHHMAAVKAPRYTIGLWGMLLCMVWTLAISGQPKRSLKRAATFLFCIWIAYQVSGTVLFIAGNTVGARAEQKVMRDIVTAARAHNLRSVVTYGEAIFGLKGQKLSMFAQNRIIFTHADAERYQKNAQFAETDLRRGYLTTGEYRISLENTLKGLGVEFDVEKIDDYFLFSDLQPAPQPDMRAVPSEAVRPVAGAGETHARVVRLLGDRNQDSAPELNSIGGETLSFDTGEVRNLCGIWMFTSQNPSATEWKRPGHFEVFVSQEGVQYDKVYSSLPWADNGFHAGPAVYIGGPWGKMEGLFAPVAARYVQIAFSAGDSLPITELFVFATDGREQQGFAEDLAQLTRFINDGDIDFVLADRWVSAGLRESFQGTGKEEIALPRFTTKYKNRPLRSFVRPEKGQALICAAAVADECSKTLTRQYGESVLSARLDLPNYTLFVLADAEGGLDPSERSALLWNGHYPLQTKDVNLLAPWLNAQGMPVWRADFTRTRGVYHDSWTNGAGRFYDLAYTISPGKDQELHLYTNGWRPDSEISSLNLSVTANNRIPLALKEKTHNTYIFSLPHTLDRLDSLEIKSTVFAPPGPDARKLGIDINRIEIH